MDSDSHTHQQYKRTPSPPEVFKAITNHLILSKNKPRLGQALPRFAQKYSAAATLQDE